MAEPNERDEEESKGWLAIIKKLVSILIGILVVAFLIAVFIFGDLLRIGG